MPHRSASYTLNRPVTATAIPAGTPTPLPAGTIVQVMQSLGGYLTVSTGHGLYRIEGAEADALPGFDVSKIQTTSGPGAATGASTGADATAAGGEFSEAAAWAALRSCFDPEIPVNIVDLGLIYDMAIEDTPSGSKVIEVKMTLTATGCGMGPTIAEDARRKLAALPRVESAKVHIVWDPVWTPQMISPEGRRALGLE